MNNEMLLIFPPQWTPVSPHFAVPSLVGQLKAEGFNVSAMDLNIDFFESILNRKSIENSLSTIKIQYEDLRNKIVKIYSPNKKESDYTFEEKLLFYKYDKLKKFVQSGTDAFKLPSFIDSAKQTFHTDAFYDPITLIKSLNVIDRSLEIVSLPYCPTKIEFDGVQNPFLKFQNVFKCIHYMFRQHY